jgi:hypothetical protein
MYRVLAAEKRRRMGGLGARGVEAALTVSRQTVGVEMAQLMIEGVDNSEAAVWTRERRQGTEMKVSYPAAV